MNLRTVFIFGAMAAAFSSQAFAESPYTTLYKARMYAAESEVAQAKIELDFENRVLTRLWPLVQQGVISRQKYEEQAVKTEVAKIEVDNRKAKATQAQTLFEVNQLRIENGLEVPVCPEGE